MQRVIAQGDMRPMADNRESMSDLQRILAVREPLYRNADLTIDTSKETVEEATELIVKTILSAGQQSAMRRENVRAGSGI
jgi:XRE family aerobic/anaerobic benzoate catabolism transcriptional regulator